MTLKQFGVDTQWMGLISFRANQWQALWAIGRSDTRTAFSLYSVVLIVLPSTMGNRVQWPVSETCCPASTSWASGVNSALPKALSSQSWTAPLPQQSPSPSPTKLARPRGDSTSMQIRSLGSLALFVSLHVQIITSFFFPVSSKQQRRVTPLFAQRCTICSLSLSLVRQDRPCVRDWSWIRRVLVLEFQFTVQF